MEDFNLTMQYKWVKAHHTHSCTYPAPVLYFRRVEDTTMNVNHLRYNTDSKRL